MAGASSEGEANHWPAFVDVLTTVIMVVTFMLVIMSAAIMALTQRVVEDLKNKVAEQQMAAAEPDSESAKNAALDGKARLASPDAEDGTSIAELGDVLRTEAPVDGADKLTIRTRETEDTLKVQIKATERPTSASGVAVVSADVLLRLDFEPLAVNLDEETSGRIGAFVKARLQPGMKFEIWSFAPQAASVSEAERLAFYRAALTRNLLVRAGVSPSSILTQIRVTDPVSKDGHNVRVVLKP